MIDLTSFQALEKSHLTQRPVLGLMSHVSTNGVLFADKDYHWAMLHREQYALKHQQFLETLLELYRSEDEEIFDQLMADYVRLYDM